MTTAEKTTTRQFERILYEGRNGICYITLNRPEKLNASDDLMHQEIIDAFYEFDADDDLQVAIISGAGRAFCSGADVRARQLRSKEELKRLGSPAGRGLRSFGTADTVNWKPVIAAVHGYAVGMGLGIVQGCDLVVAAPGTKFQLREVQRGLGGGGLWVSAWFWTGSRFANEVALTSRMFTAEEALEHGMINRIVPQEDMISTAEELARQIMENPPLSVRETTRMMRWYVQQMQRESQLHSGGLKLHLTDDFHESALAFIEKRPPDFHGR